MHLTANDIKKIVHGAVRVEDQDGKIFLCRFTEDQQKAYKVYSDDFYMKSFASAGMRLEFMTDSQKLSLSAEMKQASSKSWYSFDLYIDGALVKTEKGEHSEDGTSFFSFESELGEGVKRIALYLPWSASTTLVNFSLDDGAEIVPIEKIRKMLCFGDSITQGYITKCASFSYANRLADALEADMINKGIGGEVFFPTLAELRDEVEPDIITVAYGTNDWSHSPRDVFDENSKLFYEAIAKNYPNAKIFALAPIWRPNYNKIVKMLGEFSYVHERLREIAERIPQMTVIDCFDFVPKEKTSFATDYLHPNDRGFFHYASNLYAEIKKYL